MTDTKPLEEMIAADFREMTPAAMREIAEKKSIDIEAEAREVAAQTIRKVAEGGRLFCLY